MRSVNGLTSIIENRHLFFRNEEVACWDLFRRKPRQVTVFLLKTTLMPQLYHHICLLAICDSSDPNSVYKGPFLNMAVFPLTHSSDTKSLEWTGTEYRGGMSRASCVLPSWSVSIKSPEGKLVLYRPAGTHWLSMFWKLDVNCGCGVQDQGASVSADTFIICESCDGSAHNILKYVCDRKGRC